MTNLLPVLVAGGGPAGLAAALALRAKGFSVTVYDPAQPPIDKACGEGLLPSTVDALHKLGIILPNDAGLPFHGIRFFGHGAKAEARFPDKPGVGIRRLVLHQILVEAAQDAGVQLCWNAKVIPQDENAWIIGADGQNSMLRRQHDLASAFYETKRFSYRRHYNVAPWSDFVEVYWCAECQVYITPVGRTEVGVAAISNSASRRLNECVLQFPELAKRLSGAAPLSLERGALSVSRRLKHVQRNRLALVGDASGSVDAVTGEGIGLAFHQAILLAEAIEAQDLASYERNHRQLFRKLRVMESLLLLLARNRLLQRGALQLFQKCPAPFSRLLAAHAGSLT